MHKSSKPKLTSEQLVSKLKNDKGVTFKYITEKEAEIFLRDKNNYMRTAAYRKNYLKYDEGIHKGKYIDLDFAYLQELSIIDMHLRHIIIKMCLDIEHALKVKLVKDAEDSTLINGYDIVSQFLDENPRVINKLEGTSSSPFTKDLLFKYFIIKKVNNMPNKINNKIVGYDCPIWVLLELLSFGDFIRFYEFYYNQTGQEHIPLTLINLTKSLRNGCTHNNCILADLTKGSSHKPAIVTREIAKILEITKNQRTKKLSSRVVLEIVSMLLLYKQTVSEKVKYYRIIELKEFFDGRMIEKKGFFERNLLLVSTYDFLRKVIYAFYP